LAILRSAGNSEPSIAVKVIRPLRMPVGISTLDDPPDRAEAWLAISHLSDALEKHPDSEIVGICWKEAIAQTEKWIAALNALQTTSMQQTRMFGAEAHRSTLMDLDREDSHTGAQNVARSG
jgi:hypothetical protein